MLSYWGVDHGDEISKGLRDYVEARKTGYARNRARIEAQTPPGKKQTFAQKADLDGLKKTFTSRKYRQQQTAELKGDYQKAKQNRVSKAWGDSKRPPTQRSATRRPTTMNSRGQNAKTGAKVGAAEYGAIGAAGGALLARGKVRTLGSGLKVRSVHPKLADRARVGAKGAAGGAAVGSGVGAALGATFPTKNSKRADATNKYVDQSWKNKQAYKKKKSAAKGEFKARQRQNISSYYGS